MKVATFFVCTIGLLLVLTSSNLSGATFTVMNINDTGVGSLRWAITLANGTAGHDTIDFNIPGPGPHYIFPLSQLPLLTDQSGVFINGLTQPGADDGANPPSTAILLIVVDGTNAGLAHGFWIVSPFNTIQGLVINNFAHDGIRIQAMPMEGTFANYIYCNFIGTDQTGNIAQGNGRVTTMLWAGVDIICTPGEPGLAYNNTVDRNLISANYAEGVSISNCPPGDVFNNHVLFNYIGTDITGSVDLGNSHDGVYIGEGAHENDVDGNLISGNDFEGVCVVGYAENGIITYANVIVNNIIGLTVSLTPLGNSMDGVNIGQYGTSWYQGGFAPDNLIAYNTIAHNDSNGITVWEHIFNKWNADGNQITQNSIYDNGLLGIDLGHNSVTINDAADPDSGANQELNFPAITGANYSTGQTTVRGTIDIDTPPDSASVEIFKAKQDPTNHGEGEIYLGSGTPDALGNWVTTVTGLVPGDLVTATTTDVNYNTSEFCNNFTVPTAVEEETSTEKPLRCKLTQNLPNPFSSSTKIQYSLPKTTYMTLKIYDVSGKLVKILAEGTYRPFHYIVYWDGKDIMGRNVSPGVYFCTLVTADFNATTKLILTR